MIVQRFNLNLIPNQSPVVVHVNQYDTGAGRLIATLYEGNEPYSPSGTAVIQGTKPDGHGFQYTATLDGNVVTADLTEQMAPVAGDVRTQIVVTESSGVTGTFAFIIRVQPSALPSDTDMSESDYPLIEEAIREAQEAVIDSHDNAENSEAWAQGTRGGVPVEPTDPTYEHNAEYWAHQAESAASGVSTFNGRSGSVLPMAGDYDSEKILLASALHIGGETQNNTQEALEALENNKADRVNGAIADNFAGLDADGNLKDSGKKASDFATPSDIEQIYTDNGVLGAKNLLNVTANTQTLNGVTFTVNRDSDGNVINVTVNGTASANTSFALRTKTPLTAGKSYIMSRGEVGDADFQMMATAWNSGSYVKNIIEVGAGGYTEKSFVADYNGYNDIQISIFVRSGKTISNAKIYPMIRLASDPDDTYQPYAMTNRELTELTQIPIQRVQISFLNTITTAIPHNRIKKVGDSCRADFEFALVSAFQGNKQIGVVPTGYENDDEYCTNAVWASSSDSAASVYILNNKVYMQSNKGLSAGEVVRGSLTWFHK